MIVFYKNLGWFPARVLRPSIDLGMDRHGLYSASFICIFIYGLNSLLKQLNKQLMTQWCTYTQNLLKQLNKQLMTQSRYGEIHCIILHLLVISHVIILLHLLIISYICIQEEHSYIQLREDDTKFLTNSKETMVTLEVHSAKPMGRW